MIRVSFQGERGAYGEAAAESFFGQEGVATVPRPTFADTLEETAAGKTDFSVLPVENSIEGSVGEAYDLLYSTPLGVTGEAYHRIEHCLIGGAAGGAEDVDTVYSHPQALGQCRRFIKERGMKTIPTYDTAGSVRIVKELGDDSCACIASRKASSIYGVPVIAEDIADNPNNYTRFLVLSRDAGGQSSEEPDGGNSKTSVIFSIRHEPGSLYRIVEKFHGNNINLTKIESRPTRQSAWEYNFYVDFEGHVKNPMVSDMLDDIAREAIFTKVLGSYPSARLAD